MFLALLISNALFFRQLAVWTAGRIYRASYSGLCGRSLRRKRPRPARFDRLLSRALSFLPTPMRLMIVKDLRLFRRDPMQWSQFLIFLGLLALYFLNIRRFTYDIRLRRLGEHGQLPEPCGRGAVAVDVHDPFHLSHDQPRRPAILDPRLAAGAARDNSLEQVPLRHRRLDHALLHLGPAERHDARRAVARVAEPSDDLRWCFAWGCRALPSALGPVCRTFASSRRRGSPPALAER